MAVVILDLGYDCRECDSVLKKERGCIDNGTVPLFLGDDRFDRCPLTTIQHTTWEYIRAYALYKRSILPNGNGWLNESNKFLDAMQILESECARLEQDKLSKVKAKHGRSKA